MEYRENRDARRPFLSTPDSRVYFPAAAIEEARLATARCLRRNEGVALVVGATGTGKTLLTRVLAAEFEAESLVAVVSPTRRIDAKSFWQQFLFSLRQTFCGCDETELRLMALDYLERSQRRRCVLLIDDAQNLPFRVFDELRSFIDQGAAAASQICVALFGTTVLEERLNLPPLYPFQQRIVSRSYLDAFERSEIADYIDAESRRVGGKFVFSNSAKRTVADLCKGSPRIANQLCDRAFFLTAQKKSAGVEKSDFNENIGRNDRGADFGKRMATESVDVWEIDAPIVERAWAHLLNLPEEERKASLPSEFSDVIEFGTLNDDEDDYNDDASFSGFNAANVGEIGEIGENVRIVEENEVGRESELGPFNPVVNEREDEALEDEFDDETTENEEIDAALEARLLQNLKNWEGKDVEKELDDAEPARAVGEPNVVDRWERADALKERLNAEERSEANDASNRRAALAPVDEETEDSEVDKVDEVNGTGEVEGVGEIGKDNEINATAPFDGVAQVNEDADVEKREIAAEKRVFEALKSEYFNDGFLFEIDDVAASGSGVPKKSAAETKRKKSRKTTSKTRRPIEGDDDGSRLWNEVNGCAVDDETATNDERFEEARLTTDRVAWRSVSEAEAAAADWEAEFVSLEDRAYEQIVEDCWETTGNFDASDEYLSELSLLEQEIEEEANLIRRIRNIHLRLRSARAAGRKRRRDVEKTDDATPDSETAQEEKFDDAPLNY